MKVICRLHVTCKFCGGEMRAPLFGETLECKTCGSFAGTWVDPITRERVAEVA